MKDVLGFMQIAWADWCDPISMVHTDTSNHTCTGWKDQCLGHMLPILLYIIRLRLDRPHTTVMTIDKPQPQGTACSTVALVA